MIDFMYFCTDFVIKYQISRQLDFFRTTKILQITVLKNLIL